LTNNLLPVHVPLLIDTHVRPDYTCCIESISIVWLWLAANRASEYALDFPFLSFKQLWRPTCRLLFAQAAAARKKSQKETCTPFF
jgi:hypothetical protein